MIALPLLLSFLGCADYDLASVKEPGDADAPGDDTGEADDTGEDPPREPAWWALQATLVVVGGVPSTEGASVTLDIVDADLSRVDCSVSLDTAELAAGTPDDDAVALWWDLAVSPDAEPCATLPETLGLGIGTLLPDARARLGSVGYDDVADSLYGAYVRTGAEPLAVFGYAGTELDLGGDDFAALPPADGTYTLAPLYLLALPR